MDETLIGYWDCKYCKAKGILGTSYLCNSCGNRRGKDTKFYLSDKPIVSNVESKGPDWYCVDCDYANKFDEDVCGGCNKLKSSIKTENHDILKDDTNSNKKLIVEDGSLDKLYNNSENRKQQSIDNQKIINEHVDYTKSIKSNNHNNKISKLTNKYKTGAIVLLIISCLTFTYFFEYNRDLVIKSYHWNRTIFTQVSKTFIEKNWSVPSGGRVVSSSQEIYDYVNTVIGYRDEHYTERVQRGTRREPYTERVVSGSRRVPDGYITRSNGDGTFSRTQRYRTENTYRTETRYRSVPVYVNEDRTRKVPIYRQDPVYKTKYVYEIDRMVPDVSAIAEGNDNPIWPTIKSNQFESSRKELYWIIVLNENDPIKHYLSQSDWNKYKNSQNQNVVGTFGIFGLRRID